jgi:hypothetical protein
VSVGHPKSDSNLKTNEEMLLDIENALEASTDDDDDDECLSKKEEVCISLFIRKVHQIVFIRYR